MTKKIGELLDHDGSNESPVDDLTEVEVWVHMNSNGVCLAKYVIWEDVWLYRVISND
tara:strand:- start:448 stop:618 length:171 start_codon:yes stop_codon:yes gene_type:complete